MGVSASCFGAEKLTTKYSRVSHARFSQFLVAFFPGLVSGDPVCQNPSSSLGSAGNRTDKKRKAPLLNSLPRQFVPFLSGKYNGRSVQRESVVASPFASANSGDSEYVRARKMFFSTLVMLKQALDCC